MKVSRNDAIDFYQTIQSSPSCIKKLNKNDRQIVLLALKQFEHNSFPSTSSPEVASTLSILHNKEIKVPSSSWLEKVVKWIMNLFNLRVSSTQILRMISHVGHHAQEIETQIVNKRKELEDWKKLEISDKEKSPIYGRIRDAYAFMVDKGAKTTRSILETRLKSARWELEQAQKEGKDYSCRVIFEKDVENLERLLNYNGKNLKEEVKSIYQKYVRQANHYSPSISSAKVETLQKEIADLETKKASLLFLQNNLRS